MDEILDRSDSTTTFSSTLLLDGFSIIAEKSKLGEGYLIQCYGPDKLERDARQAMFRIYHNPSFNGKKRREILHEPIYFVVDLKNHKGKEPFHLNLSGLSKIIDCPKCRKYFLPLDHLKVVSKLETDGARPYKIIDWNDTTKKFV